MKMAMFRDSTYDWCKPQAFTLDFAKHLTGYVQVSDVVDVEFPPLSDEVIVKQQLDALDAKEKELRNTFQMHLDEIINQRARLQALTFVPAVQ